MPAYLDNAATTPMHPEAVEAMLPFFTERFANPSGAHALARDARRAVDEAREVMAELLGAEPREIVFTSGGTESDNLAVFGVSRTSGGRVVCSAIEHHAVLDPVLACDGQLVPVDGRGILDLDGLAGLLGDDVALVSVMLANNEIGTIQPLGEVADIVRERAPDARLHTDAVQAFSWLDVATQARPADLISISAHKFGGPKGIGVLVVRDGAELTPMLLGGGQEHERRSGTHNVAGIVGMATAATITAERQAATVERVAKLRDRLAEGLIASVPGAIETAVPRHADGPDRSHKIAGNCHLCIEDIESEALLFLLEKHEVYASAASSCASGAMELSHVLSALEVASSAAGGSLRLSLGPQTTDADVDAALDAVPAAVERLRRFG